MWVRIVEGRGLRRLGEEPSRGPAGGDAAARVLAGEQDPLTSATGLPVEAGPPQGWGPGLDSRPSRLNAHEDRWGEELGCQGCPTARQIAGTQRRSWTENEIVAGRRAE